ncbi:HD domain-containing protein [Gorillibacterium sp. sgz5001074]|uniref:HD domain-containing protein n=1 Tax=Gorillibacterium sp. sgz5001074 TaxID=3446695 RepID=UPI003F680F77
MTEPEKQHGQKPAAIRTPAEAAERILAEAERYARERLEGETTGHDWWHIKRVADSARSLAEVEQADGFVCVLAALLHDLADEKICGDEAQGLAEISRWMAEAGVADADREHVLEIVSTMSFKGGGRPPMRTPEGRVVQDADRLDAIGAMGIARVFVYSGAKGRPAHDPEVKPREQMTAEEYRSGKDTAVNHFYEKLLKLKDLMNTAEGRRRAEARHAFMEEYLERFYGEWEGRL